MPAGPDVQPQHRPSDSTSRATCSSATRTRAAKTAYIDDHGSLTYGELDAARAAWRPALRAPACGARSACCC